MKASPSRFNRLGRDFGLLFTASTLSNVGDGVLVAAVPLLARRLSDDPITVSAVTVASTLPWLLFGLLAGTVVDRVDRQRAMITTDVLRAAAIGLLAFIVATDSVTVSALVVAMFLLGVAETVFDTAGQALIPSVVSTDQLERANGRLFGAQIAANGFVGPPIGAVLFSLATFAPFIVDAISFVLSAALLTQLYGRRSVVAPPAPTAKTTIRADVREGLAWLWKHDGIRSFAIAAAVINLAYIAAMAVAVFLLRDELRSSELAFGVAFSAAAIGSIAGTQLASTLVTRLGRGRAVLISIGVFSASLFGLAASPHVAVAAACLGTFGLAGEVWNVVAVSYRQTLVPDRLLGRVMATYRVIAYGSMPVGAALGGLIAAAAGVRATFIAGGGAIALLLVYFSSPRRTEMLSLTVAPPDEATGAAEGEVRTTSDEVGH